MLSHFTIPSPIPFLTRLFLLPDTALLFLPFIEHDSTSMTTRRVHYSRHRGYISSFIVARPQGRASSSPFDLLSYSYLSSFHMADSHSLLSCMYLSQHPAVVVNNKFQSIEVHSSRVLIFPSQDAFLFFSLHVTSARLRSHADASYRAAVCIFSDVLLLTVLFSPGSSYLYPPELTSALLSGAT